MTSSATFAREALFDCTGLVAVVTGAGSGEAPAQAAPASAVVGRISDLTSGPLQGSGW